MIYRKEALPKPDDMKIYLSGVVTNAWIFERNYLHRTWWCKWVNRVIPERWALWLGTVVIDNPHITFDTPPDAGAVINVLYSTGENSVRLDN